MASVYIYIYIYLYFIQSYNAAVSYVSYLWVAAIT